MLRFAGLFMSIFHEKLTVPSNCRDFLKIAEFFTESYNTLSPTLYGTTMTSGAASIIASDFMPYLFSENTKETITNLCQNKEHLLSAMKQYLQMTHYATQQPWWLDSVSQLLTETQQLLSSIRIMPHTSSIQNIQM